jgi:hypothetical protein
VTDASLQNLMVSNLVGPVAKAGKIRLTVGASGMLMGSGTDHDNAFVSSTPSLGSGMQLAKQGLDAWATLPSRGTTVHQSRRSAQRWLTALVPRVPDSVDPRALGFRATAGPSLTVAIAGHRRQRPLGSPGSTRVHGEVGRQRPRTVAGPLHSRALSRAGEPLGCRDLGSLTFRHGAAIYPGLRCSWTHQSVRALGRRRL